MIVKFFRAIRRASKATHDAIQLEFLATCKLAMLGTLLLGLFHQVDQTPPLYILLAWGYGSASAYQPPLDEWRV